jgi:hypothetical protein
VDREITESSEVQQLRVELYRVNGSDYRTSNCDTADGSNYKIVNCVSVRASGINSLYPIRREVTCRALYTQHVTIRSHDREAWNQTAGAVCRLPAIISMTVMRHQCWVQHE